MTDIWRHQGPILIAGAIVLDPEGELHRPAAQDILIEGKTIVALGEEARIRGQQARVFNARGLIVTPGVRQRTLSLARYAVARALRADDAGKLGSCRISIQLAAASS